MQKIIRIYYLFYVVTLVSSWSGSPMFAYSYAFTPEYIKFWQAGYLT